MKKEKKAERMEECVFPLVGVSWKDASGAYHDRPPINVEVVKEEAGLLPTWTAGWLLEEDEEKVILAHSLDLSNGEWRAHDNIAIPKAWGLKMWRAGREGRRVEKRGKTSRPV